MAKKAKPKSKTQQPQRTRTPKPARPPIHWTAIFASRGARAGAILLVIALAVMARFVHLGADPPLDVSWSQDLFTDPPQYTSYARNAVEFGDWNPLNDDRLVFFQKNVTGVVSYIVFSITGPSVAMGQLVAVLLNLLAVGMLAWATGRAFGFMAGWATAMFLSLNYLFVSYGRMPFLEVASNACLAAALWGLVASVRRWWMVIVAGAIAGIGTFFGKITSLHAMPVFFLAAALAGWQAKEESKRTRWGRPIGFAGGFAVVFVSWYLYAYLPASAEVLAYLKEQSLSLYGTPIGLTSVLGFLSQWFTFGMDTEILTWGPMLTLLGFLGMAFLLTRYFIGSSFKEIMAHVPPAGFAILGWFWSAWAAFMPFNYRPVRYQIVLLFPLAACAGWFVAYLCGTVDAGETKQRPRPSWRLVILLTIVLTTAIQHLVLSHWYNPRSMASLRDTVLLSLILAAVVAAVVVVLLRRDPTTADSVLARFSRPLAIAVGLTMLVMLGNQGRHFLHWWSMSASTLEQANRDLEAILSDGAILTGGYGTALTQDKRLGNFPAMFGVSEVDREFFQKYPVTHVAEVDQQNQPFFKNYPEIAGQAERITSYFIRNLAISIYRVASLGNNPDAAGYHLSAFERMRHQCADLPRDTLLTFLPQWIADSADVYSGWRWLGDLYYTSNRLQEARMAYRHASDSFSDDFSLWALIGDVSWEMFRQGTGSEDRQAAIDAWTRALRLSPGNPQLQDRMNRAYGR